jgi:hypothetical protein
VSAWDADHNVHQILYNAGTHLSFCEELDLQCPEVMVSWRDPMYLTAATPMCSGPGSVCSAGGTERSTSLSRPERTTPIFGPLASAHQFGQSHQNGVKVRQGPDWCELQTIQAAR